MRQYFRAGLSLVAGMPSTGKIPRLQYRHMMPHDAREGVTLSLQNILPMLGQRLAHTPAISCMGRWELLGTLAASLDDQQRRCGARAHPPQ
jgi:hypothetical protein